MTIGADSRSKRYALVENNKLEEKARLKRLPSLQEYAKDFFGEEVCKEVARRLQKVAFTQTQVTQDLNKFE